MAFLSSQQRKQGTLWWSSCKCCRIFLRYSSKEQWTTSKKWQHLRRFCYKGFFKYDKQSQDARKITKNRLKFHDFNICPKILHVDLDVDIGGIAIIALLHLSAVTLTKKKTTNSIDINNNRRSLIPLAEPSSVRRRSISPWDHSQSWPTSSELWHLNSH